MDRLLYYDEPIVIPKQLPALTYNGKAIGCTAAHFIQKIHYHVVGNERRSRHDDSAYQYQHDGAWWAIASASWWVYDAMPWISLRTFQRLCATLSAPCGLDGDYGLLIVDQHTCGESHKRNSYRVNHYLLEIHAHAKACGIPVENYADKVAASLGVDDNVAAYLRQYGGIPPLLLETTKDNSKRHDQARSERARTGDHRHSDFAQSQINALREAINGE